MYRGPVQHWEHPVTDLLYVDARVLALYAKRIQYMPSCAVPTFVVYLLGDSYTCTPWYSTGSHIFYSVYVNSHTVRGSIQHWAHPVTVTYVLVVHHLGNC